MKPPEREAVTASQSLYEAAGAGDRRLVEVALAQGGDPNAVCGVFEETAFIAALRKGHLEIVQMLLKHGANPNETFLGSPALFLTVQHAANKRLFELLIAAGVDIQAKSRDQTLFMAACEGGDHTIIKRLVEMEVDIHAIDQCTGRSALDYVQGTKDKALIAYLKSLGIAAHRDKPQALTRALARKCGGKPWEHSSGFVLNTRLGGYRCQFNIEHTRCSVLVDGIRSTDAGMRAAKDRHVLVIEEEPSSYEQTYARVGDFRLASGHAVFRSVDPAPLASEVAARFYERHEGDLAKFSPERGEVIMLLGNSASMFCPMGDVQHVEQRVEAFADLIEALFLPPQPDRVLFTGEWLLKTMRKDVTGSPHQFGGMLKQPADCPHCHRQTHLMVSLDLADPDLPLSVLGRRELPVMWCMNCMEWSPVHFDVSGDFPVAIKLENNTPDIIDPGINAEPLTSKGIRLVPVSAGKKAGRASKLGGKPSWIQTDETPDCPKCEKAMAFVLQLRSSPDMSYADEGMLYAFACPECQVVSSLVQSH